MTRKLSEMEKAVFGADAKLHPVTDRVIEQGSGALPEKVQVQQQLAAIEKEHGKDVADQMRTEIEFFEIERTQGKVVADRMRKEILEQGTAH
jgi:hypothetical protein